MICEQFGGFLASYRFLPKGFGDNSKYFFANRYLCFFNKYKTVQMLIENLLDEKEKTIKDHTQKYRSREDGM